MKILTKIILASFLVLIASSCKKNEDKKIEKEVVVKTIKPNSPESFKGDYCFLKAENKDTTKVSVRFLSNDDIRGEMIWKPWQKDGAVGTLTGKLNANNEMELVYNYMIEGNRQTETKIMKIEGNKLLIKQGELVDPKNNGNLIFKDVSKATFKTILDKIDCE